MPSAFPPELIEALRINPPNAENAGSLVNRGVMKTIPPDVLMQLLVPNLSDTFNQFGPDRGMTYHPFDMPLRPKEQGL